MRQLFRALSILALLTPCAASQEDALQLIKRVAANYVALRTGSYDFEQVDVREYEGTYRNRTEQRRRLAGSGGKYRDEVLPSGPLYLFDGQYKWSYNPERNEYTRTAGVLSLAPDLAQLETVAHRAKSARLLRQENLQLDTGTVSCQVIEVEPEPAEGQVQYSRMTYWIDAARNIVLKLNYKISIATPDKPAPSESTVTMSFSKAYVGGPVDQALLRFVPPAGAVQVDRLFFGPKSTLAGKDGPPFELQDAEGKPISSKSLRGETVLLRFGSRSDEDALFSLEMIYRSLKGKGLTVFYVVNSRDPGMPGAAYTVPVAVDPEGSVAKKFGISTGGIVLIDRLGKIAYGYAPSPGNSSELVRALQIAGVW